MNSKMTLPFTTTTVLLFLLPYPIMVSSGFVDAPNPLAAPEPNFGAGIARQSVKHNAGANSNRKTGSSSSSSSAVEERDRDEFGANSNPKMDDDTSSQSAEQSINKQPKQQLDMIVASTTTLLHNPLANQWITMFKRCANGSGGAVPSADARDRRGIWTESSERTVKVLRATDDGGTMPAAESDLPREMPLPEADPLFHEAIFGPARNLSAAELSPPSSSSSAEAAEEILLSSGINNLPPSSREQTTSTRRTESPPLKPMRLPNVVAKSASQQQQMHEQRQQIEQQTAQETELTAAADEEGSELSAEVGAALLAFMVVAAVIACIHAAQKKKCRGWSADAKLEL